MQKKESTQAPIDCFIMQIIREKNPETVEQLVRLVCLEHQISKGKVMEQILRLHNQGKIILKNYPTSFPSTASEYLFSTQAIWYWMTLALSLVTTTTVFTIPEEAFPVVYVRYILGSIFVMLLPGYCFIKALFPTKELDNIERVALSLGMSLALVPVTGLLLNYTPWGLGTTPIILSLLALTITFATIAIFREYQAKLRKTVNSLTNTNSSSLTVKFSD